jgi:hypothetical protein
LLPILSVGRDNIKLSRPADHRIIATVDRKRKPSFPHVSQGDGFNALLLRPSDGRAALTAPLSFAIIFLRPDSHYRMLHSPLPSGSIFLSPSLKMFHFLSLSPPGAGGNAHDDIPQHASFCTIGYRCLTDPFWIAHWASQYNNGLRSLSARIDDRGDCPRPKSSGSLFPNIHFDFILIVSVAFVTSSRAR